MSSSANINDGFLKMYPYVGYFAAILVVTLFIISAIDIFSFLSAELGQKISLMLNPNLLNKDSIEQILFKLATNNSKTSAYNIFLEQQVVALMYWCVAGTIMYIIIHTLLVFFLNLKDKNKTQEAPVPVPAQVPDTQVSKNDMLATPFLSVLTMFGLSLVYSATFTNYFVKDVQPDIIELTKSVKDISELVYDNLCTDEVFLKNVVDDKMSECYKIINKQGNRAEKIGSMIFTMSLFNYYKTSSDKRVFEKVKSIFTTTQIRLRSVDPFGYLYYNQKTFIPNLYQTTEDKITAVLDTPAKRSAVRQNVKTRLNDLNRKLVNMFLISSIRSNVRMYMIVCCIIALVFTIIICVIYGKELLKFYTDVLEKILQNKTLVNILTRIYDTVSNVWFLLGLKK